MRHPTASASAARTISGSRSAPAQRRSCSCKSRRRACSAFVSVGGQAANGATDAVRILDNSFLVEEAFNQEPGIFQNIFGVQLVDGGDGRRRSRRNGRSSPQAHQFSFTFSSLAVDGAAGLGDVMINYRWQASMEEGAAAGLFTASLAHPADWKCFRRSRKRWRRMAGQSAVQQAIRRRVPALECGIHAYTRRRTRQR